MTVSSAPFLPEKGKNAPPDGRGLNWMRIIRRWQTESSLALWCLEVLWFWKVDGARPWNYSFLLLLLFFSKEETDSLPVLLFILENQMLLKKPFSLPFPHPNPTSLLTKITSIFSQGGIPKGLPTFTLVLQSKQKGGQRHYKPIEGVQRREKEAKRVIRKSADFRY